MHHKYELEVVTIKSKHALRVKNLYTNEEFFYYSWDSFWLLMDDIIVKIDILDKYFEFKAEIQLVNEDNRKYLIVKEINFEEAKIPINAATVEINEMKFTPMILPEIRRTDNC